MSETSGKLVSPIHAEKWWTLDLFGRPAYSDRGLCLIGAPPSRATRLLPPDGAGRLERALVKRDAPMAIKKRDLKYVYFDQLNLPIDVRYYEHVLTEYPAATFHAPKGRKSTNPIAIKSDGQIVGAVMCVDV